MNRMIPSSTARSVRTVSLVALALGVGAPAHAVIPQVGVRVAVLGAAVDPVYNKEVVDTLMASSRGVGMPDVDNSLPRAAWEITQVDMFDVAAEIPRTEDLVDYDVLLVYNDETPFADAVALGDVVATMIEAGTSVLLAGNTVDQSLGLQGRFLTQNHSPVEYGTAAAPAANLRITALDLADEWLPGPTRGITPEWGVVEIDGGSASYHVEGLVPLPQAEVTHTWTDGSPALVLQTPAISGHGHVALVNVYPPSERSDPSSWDYDSHVGKLLVQTALWTQGHTRTYGFCMEFDPFFQVWVPQRIPPFEIPPPPLCATCQLASTFFGEVATKIACRDAATDCLPNPNGISCTQNLDVRTELGGVATENKQTFQDLNCNGTDVYDEPLFDPNIDAQCLANIDPNTGDPYDNLDYYHDFNRFTCDYVTDSYDVDHDQLSAGTITILEENGVEIAEVVNLSCDNCPEYFNPNQYDWDLDGVGDLCDLCPYVVDPPIPGTPGQIDSDYDELGDSCDNCFLVANTDQWDVDDDGNGDLCDNCPDVYNPVMVAFGAPLLPGQFGFIGDQLGQADWDQDGAGDACDNCLLYPYLPEGVFDVSNPDQLDSDGDRWGDACDNCDLEFNPGQNDIDRDTVGDLCDNCPGIQTSDISDRDEDGLGDVCDNCDTTRNADQIDADADALGDACDNCPLNSNADQFDTDEDGVGDACDNCAEVFNPEQSDGDEDGAGDVCDNCAEFRNDQEDRDGDGFGDDCDFCLNLSTTDNLDSDGDGVGDGCDNCPYYVNFDQLDDDNDGLGNTCDVLGIRGGGELRPVSQGCDSTGGAAGLLGLIPALAAFAARRRRAA